MTERLKSILMVLLEVQDVVVYKIPPGEISLSRWDLKDSSVIWRGGIRLSEQETIEDDSDMMESVEGAPDIGSLILDDTVSTHEKMPKGDFVQQPQKGLRLKLELLNEIEIPPTIGSLTTTRKEDIWAEVWFNPVTPVKRLAGNDDLNNCIANNGQETIQQVPGTNKYFKIIAQLPDQSDKNEDAYSNNSVSKNVQVALGLKFNGTYDAIEFAAAIALYRRRYNDFMEQSEYDLKLEQADSNLESDNLFHEKLNDLINPSNSYIKNENFDITSEMQQDESDESESSFGDFVG